MVISCDLSPSSATNTTERLTSAAVSMRTPFDTSPTGQSLTTRQTSVEGLAHRSAVRRPGCAPVCRLDDWGLLPFADIIDDSGDFTELPLGDASSGTRIEHSGRRIKSFENPYAASSMAKIAVSGWLMGVDADAAHHRRHRAVRFGF